MQNEIKYQAIWGRLYILLGVLFGILFVSGGVILNDYTIYFNLIGSVIIIHIGYSMLNQPYVRYAENELVVYGFLGQARKHYKFDSIHSIKIKDNRLYHQNKKLKLNNWMVDKQDWKRMLAFFDPEDKLINELND